MFASRWVEIVMCTVLVAAMSIFALWKMDYLSPKTAHHIRMTDSTRTAYVARNIANGDGYTTNELPAFLVDFYDHVGKLHDEHWTNADRFPFTAYAIAALYLVTGSRSFEVGILLYNVICFVGMLVALYWIARRIWHDRWPALLAVGIALLHPLTYIYLYLKDADMMLLVLGTLAAFYRYFESGPGALTWKRAAFMGTMLGWLYLARPNIGGVFAVYFGVLVLRRLWVERSRVGLGAAIREVARREGIVLAVIVLWLLPFAIHSLSEWGTPFFSANALYQRPLGTRFAMDTDTWWKYSEPGADFSLSSLIAHDPTDMRLKFTTSWITSIKYTVRPWALEILSTALLIAWLKRRATTPSAEDNNVIARESAFRRLAPLVLVAVCVNLAILPLYGYQNYGYRHYLSFFMPLVWIASGRALALLLERVRPVIERGVASMRAHPGPWALAGAAAVIAWNIGARPSEDMRYFVRTGNFVAGHWLTITLLCTALLMPRWFRRVSRFQVGVLVVGSVVFSCYQPTNYFKRYNLNWFPADTRVWKSLREGHGLVMSFAMQGEVNWVSDRKNIPAPENILHAYSLRFDHQLDVQDVYIESAETMVGPIEGPFYYAAPGFESYVRMERYQGRLPGYEIVFHHASQQTYPKFKVTKPRSKASTVYRLSDLAAVEAMRRSPDQIELGDVANVVYTTHGWGGYFNVDGKGVVAATDDTRTRYRQATFAPWEDTSVSFFLDDRRPTSIDLEIYATHATTLELYWNLDLYIYDAASDRPAHSLGTYKVTQPGWQTVHLTVPPGMTRRGLNKLGFRTGSFEPYVVCPPSITPDECAKELPPAPIGTSEPPPITLQDASVTAPIPMRASLFARSLKFNYTP